MAPQYQGIYIPTTPGDFYLYRMDGPQNPVHIAVVAVDEGSKYSTHMAGAHTMEDMKNLDAIVEFAREWKHDYPRETMFNWEPAPQD